MGAPGYYVLCKNGHEIGMIEDDLYWDWDCDEHGIFLCQDKGLFKVLKDYENGVCSECGEKATYEFCHYGYGIDDCLHHLNGKLEWNTNEQRWIFPENMTDEQKKELEGCKIQDWKRREQ